MDNFNLENTSIDEFKRKIFSSEYNEILEKKLRPKINKIEQKRIEAIRNTILLTLIDLIVNGIIIYYFIKTECQNVGIFVLLFALLLCCLIFPIYSFRYNSKKEILPTLLRLLGKFHLNNIERISKREEIYTKVLKLFNRYTNYECDDLICGTYKNRRITIAEISLTKEYYNGRYNTIEIIFNGLLIRLKTTKKFKSYTVISLNELKTEIKEHRIKLESNDFNNRYYVYGLDQIESRLLLTPVFMERLLKISESIDIRNFSLSFEDGYLNIAVPTLKNWFEVPTRNSADDMCNYKKILYDIASILSLIDAIEFNENNGV